MRQRSSLAVAQAVLLSFLIVVSSVQSLATCPRRTFLHDAGLAVGSAMMVTAIPVQADDTVLVDRGGKPFAPLETLLPATRLKLWVDEAYELSRKLADTEDKINQYKVLQQMNGVLSNRPKLFTDNKVPRERTSRPTAQLTTGISSVNKEQYKNLRSDLSIPDKMAAILNQADVERQFGMLQYAESKREQSNEMRLALNYYTQSLTFGDAYTLTASKEDKKRMIRNDELPKLSTVITSDLDLRDLYRNQFLTAIEDVIAEVAYQIKQDQDTIDRADAIALMTDAHTACTKWFGLIPDADLEEAIGAARLSSQ